MHIRGKVVDKVTLQPLVGVNISLENNYLGIGTITNSKGEFRLWNLPHDTSKIIISHNGYEESAIEVDKLSNKLKPIAIIKLDEKSKNQKNTNPRKLTSLKKRSIARK